MLQKQRAPGCDRQQASIGTDLVGDCMIPEKSGCLHRKEKQAKTVALFVGSARNKSLAYMVRSSQFSAWNSKTLIPWGRSWYDFYQSKQVR